MKTPSSILRLLRAAAAAGALALSAVRADADTNFAYRIDCEVQNPSGSLEPLVWEQGTTPLVEVRVLRQNRVVQVRDTTVRMIIGPSATGHYFAAVSNSVWSDINTCMIQWPSIGTNSMETGSWWYGITFHDPEGRIYWTGSGSLDIQPTLSNGEDGLIWQYFADSTERITYITTNTYYYVTTNLEEFVHSVNGQTGDVSVPSEERVGAIEEATNALHSAVAANAARLDSMWVVNAGGYHYPDYFFATARAGGEPVETVAISTNKTLNAVETLHETTSVRGWLLGAEIERQSEFGTGVEWSLGPEAEGLWRLDGDMVVPDGATPETIATGEVFSATGRLGDFRRTVRLEVTRDNVSTSGAWQFDRWKEGSLAGSAAEAESMADEGAALSSHVRTWPEGYGSGTNHVSAGWNGDSWIQSRVFSAVSYHTDTAPGVAGGTYRPVTLVTPRHGVVANHFKPIPGSNVYWVGISGAIHTNQVVAYVNLRGDLTVARLAAPVDESDFEFPFLLPDDYEWFFYGCEHGGIGCKGVPVVSFNNVEAAWLTYWQCASAMTAKHGRDSKAYTVKARGAGTAHGRQAAAIGGDSGSPTFLRVLEAGDEPMWVLLGCFLWGGGETAGGPIPLADEVNAAIAAWGDEERASVADFEAWGYGRYNPGPVPW